MTQAKDTHGAPPEGIEIRPGIYHHPKSPDSNPERLQQLAGIIRLSEPLPRHLLDAWMNGDDEEDDGGC